MNKLPFDFDFNDFDIFYALIPAKTKIYELNGMSRLLPNPQIILNAVTLGEAKESSEIENIVTTYDEIFKELTLNTNNLNSKEVIHYRRAILEGFEDVKENEFISLNMINKIHNIIEPDCGDIRKVPGTVIMNTKTKEIIHNPPQNKEEIMDYLTNLENYINYDNDKIDPLIKMCFIHFQFETIHPYLDGNGRTGRIINILYLILKNELKFPILYLSKYINKNRQQYYELLNNIHKDSKYLKDYVIYMLNGIYETCDSTITFITNILDSIKQAEEIIKEKCPKIYSKELVNYLFYDFYTKNEYLCIKFNITRNTASKYLNELVNIGVLIEEKVGKNKIYKNAFLYNIMRFY